MRWMSSLKVSGDSACIGRQRREDDAADKHQSKMQWLVWTRSFRSHLPDKE